MRLTWWSRFIRAHVVLPVGGKANWSLMVSDGMAGFNHLLTTIFSAMRDRIAVTEIGRESPEDVGVATFGLSLIHI